MAPDRPHVLAATTVEVVLPVDDVLRGEHRPAAGGDGRSRDGRLLAVHQVAPEEEHPERKRQHEQ